MAWRMLGCLLLGITYGLLTAGPKDKTALKIATVGQAIMAGFGTDAATYAQTMWKTQLVVHAAMTYVGYSASQPTKTRSSSRRR